jgi:hypothetical protein
MTSGPFEFLCPIAAAAIVSARSLGISAQGVSGGWQNSRPIVAGATALRHLESLLSQVSIEKQDDFVRRAVRGWYLEAMETFVEAAQSGHFAAQWTPSATANLDFSAWTSQGFRTGDAVSKLDDLLCLAAQLCSAHEHSTSALAVI